MIQEISRFVICDFGDYFQIHDSGDFWKSVIRDSGDFQIRDFGDYFQIHDSGHFQIRDLSRFKFGKSSGKSS